MSISSLLRFLKISERPIQFPMLNFFLSFKRIFWWNLIVDMIFIIIKKYNILTINIRFLISDTSKKKHENFTQQKIYRSQFLFDSTRSFIYLKHLDFWWLTSIILLQEFLISYLHSASFSYILLKPFILLLYYIELNMPFPTLSYINRNRYKPQKTNNKDKKRTKI